jgi:hypothetical protein
VATWYILWLFGIFSRFGMLYQEKSGNPVRRKVTSGKTRTHESAVLHFAGTRSEIIIFFLGAKNR